MRSHAEGVVSYLEEVPDDRREAVDRLARTCREELAGFEESMAYGMPSYARNGVVEVAFASQRQYISLYVIRSDVMAAHRDQLSGLNVGKSCIRYRNTNQLDEAAVRSMLRATAAATGPVC